MKRSHFLASFLPFLVVTVFAVTACRPASYEIIPGKKGKKTDETDPPQNFGSDGQDPDQNDRDTNGRGDQDGKRPDTSGTVTDAPPTARVEVILNGKAVTKIRAGSAVTIQPTHDTVDLDDVGKSQCRNPGIVVADYDVGANAQKSATRSSGCESLHVGHTFDQEGEFLIKMIVKTDENETATASMTLIVLPREADDWDKGGFTIAGKPMITTPDQPITFTGHCESKTENLISWSYGDEAIAEGRIVTHGYAKVGQYKVDALCTDQDGHEWDASITIVVVETPVTPPGKPTPGTPDPADPDPSGPIDGGDGGDGDDGGSPDKPNQGDPDQNVPVQDRKWPNQG